MMMNQQPGLYGISGLGIMPQESGTPPTMQGLIPMMLRGSDGKTDLGQAKHLSLLAMLLGGARG